MQKVYLLLRNNHQEGPFDLQELLQFPVKETDLIWVEGKSAAWMYPTEINELKSYFESSPTSARQNSTTRSGRNEPADDSIIHKHKHIFVSLPHHTDMPAEKKAPTPEEALASHAEALRQRIQTYGATHAPKEPELIHTNLQRSVDDVAIDYADWTLKSKAKKKNPITTRAVLLVVFISVTLSLAWVLFSPKVTDEKSPEKEPVLVNEQPVNNNQSDIIPSAENAVVIANEPEKELPKKENKKTTPKIPAKKEDTLIAILPAEDSHVVAEAEPIADKPVPIITEEKGEEPVVVEEKKKKSFGDAIDGFFGKFKTKKNEEDKELDSNSAKRKSTKREETKIETPVLVDVANQLKLSSSKASEDWMLGVKGMKITLQNASGMLVENAVVEVQYFDEEENLLEKKMIAFKNIKPNQKSTQAVPDHRLASHTTHKIVSAMGISNGAQ